MHALSIKFMVEKIRKIGHFSMKKVQMYKLKNVFCRCESIFLDD